MKILPCQRVETAPVDSSDAVGCRMCCLIGPNDAAPSFSMRLFEIAPGGHTPKHSHAHEHEAFILEGEAAVFGGDREQPVQQGAAVFIPPNELHQFRNTGTGTLKFLCLIPHPLRGVRDVCVAACGCDG
ncbi:MAG: cupin domain-containing protein [Planctomycetaceae bacterium]|nr:cupin domain-containing protein [Planctomycetaceae bacterium]